MSLTAEETDQTWGSDQFSELGGAYVYYPYYGGLYTNLQEQLPEARFSDSLEILKKLADLKKCGAVWKFRTGHDEDPNDEEDEPCYVPSA